MIRDNVFRDNLVSGSTVSGGAIYATNSNPVIQDNRFMNNQVTATGSGGSGGTASGGASTPRMAFRSSRITAS